MKEALHYESLENEKVKCLLCPQGCLIVKNNLGVCGVRENIDGKLYTLVYKKPVAIHVDPIEKKPLYHFFPGSRILSIGTYGCNLSCQFCQNWDISQEFEVEHFNLIEDIEPQRIIEMCKQKNLEFVAFTYNEPTIYYEYMLEIAKLCKENNYKTVIVSNGQINKKPLRELIKYIDAFNIDLKSFNPDFYKKICKGDFETTKDTLNIIVEENKHLEVTFLLIKGLNDNEFEFKAMCEFIKSLGDKVVFHISRAFPGYKMNFSPTPYSLMKRFEEIAKRYVKYVYLGNI